jgi:hypothetical protein
MQNLTPAEINAETALYAQARSSAASLVKQRARAYATRPLTCLLWPRGRRARYNARHGKASLRDGTADAPPVVWVWR